MLLVGHDGLSEQIRQRCEIVTPARDELAFVRYRHADVGLAESLRLELPSAYALEVVATEPQSAAGRIRIDAAVTRSPNIMSIAISDSLASGFQHKPAT